MRDLYIHIYINFSLFSRYLLCFAINRIIDILINTLAILVIFINALARDLSFGTTILITIQ